MWGWVDWKNPLNPVDPATLAEGGVATFGLRIDKRKVPAVILKAHVDQRIRALMAAKDLAFIGKEARISIQDEVLAELLPKVMPSTRVVICQWNSKEGLFHADGRSDALVAQVMKTFGVELAPLGPLLLAGRVAPALHTEELMALDPLDLTLEVAHEA